MYKHLSPSGSSWSSFACLLSPSNCRGTRTVTPPYPHPRSPCAPRRARPIRPPHPRARPPPLPHHAPPRRRPPALPSLPLLSVLVLRRQASRARPDLLVLHRPLRPSRTSTLHSQVHAHPARSSSSRDKNDDAESTQAQLAALRAQVAGLDLAVAQLAAPDREDALYAYVETRSCRSRRAYGGWSGASAGCARGARSSRPARTGLRVGVVRVKAKRYSSPRRPRPHYPHARRSRS
ncbi:hypothetical protein DFH08DRAFT_892378 [Mycena albidolilacea]|uniref:Uncharacterized protein n=1 Tax=Mycena albidolilacea TaxID=1033008 RepID=A0AAD7EEM3_9AGAR|nr:hypothetical protein DFH08DRAFT_892378 [Mycena albidolilacea]